MVEGFEVKDQILRVDQETLDTTSFYADEKGLYHTFTEVCPSSH